MRSSNKCLPVVPSRYSKNDPHTYEDSPVLMNKGNFCTKEELKIFELLWVTKQMVDEPPKGDFDYAHLKALHRHLFQEVYEWAGNEREEWYKSVCAPCLYKGSS